MSQTETSQGDETKIVIAVLAQGLVDAHNQIVEGRGILGQSQKMPRNLRRGLAMLSAFCLKSGHDVDLGAQPNAFTEIAGRPVGEWGPKPFADCEDRDLVLVDLGCGVPTAECRQVAGSEIDTAEDIFHERLRSALVKLGDKRAPIAYARVREFIVRNPCLPMSEMIGFVQEYPQVATDIMSFYRALPFSSLQGHRLRICAGCGAPLFRVPDIGSYPHGRCAVRECRMINGTQPPRDEIQIDDLDSWRLAERAVLSYWVGPGLPEVQLYDELSAILPEAVTLYPLSDSADVGIRTPEIGIDVKSYSSSVRLGQHFAKSCGNLELFGRRIVAVPDAWLVKDRDYLTTLRAVAGNKFRIDFMTTSQVVREFRQ
jgi:hypothetical protein